jgi:hypothetical protein
MRDLFISKAKPAIDLLRLMQLIPVQHAKPAKRAKDAGDLNDSLITKVIPAAEYHVRSIMAPEELLYLYRRAAAYNQTGVQLVVLGNSFG